MLPKINFLKNFIKIYENGKIFCKISQKIMNDYDWKRLKMIV